jgi:hypothetical protein
LVKVQVAGYKLQVINYIFTAGTLCYAVDITSFVETPERIEKSTNWKRGKFVLSSFARVSFNQQGPQEIRQIVQVNVTLMSFLVQLLADGLQLEMPLTGRFARPTAQQERAIGASR